MSAEMGEAGERGRPGQEAVGAVGGRGGEGGAGGRGGIGISPGRSSRPWVGYLALIAACGSVLFSVWLYARSVEARGDLCGNQHAVIEMQRLFLREHAAIRMDLEGAGIPNEHNNPDLLSQLQRLIEAADCLPNDR